MTIIIAHYTTTTSTALEKSWVKPPCGDTYKTWRIRRVLSQQDIAVQDDFCDWLKFMAVS